METENQSPVWRQGYEKHEQRDLCNSAEVDTDKQVNSSLAHNSKGKSLAQEGCTVLATVSAQTLRPRRGIFFWGGHSHPEVVPGIITSRTQHLWIQPFSTSPALPQVVQDFPLKLEGCALSVVLQLLCGPQGDVAGPTGSIVNRQPAQGTLSGSECPLSTRSFFTPVSSGRFLLVLNT